MWLLSQLTYQLLLNVSFITLQTAHLDVRVQGFWGIHHQHKPILIFVCLILWLHQIISLLRISTCFRYHDRKKCHVYGQYVSDVEQGPFTPFFLYIMV